MELLEDFKIGKNLSIENIRKEELSYNFKKKFLYKGKGYFLSYWNLVMDKRRTKPSKKYLGNFSIYANNKDELIKELKKIYKGRI